MLRALSDIELVEMTIDYRKTYPNTWEGGNPVRLCDSCADRWDEHESPEQYEIRRMLEDSGGSTSIGQ